MKARGGLGVEGERTQGFGARVDQGGRPGLTAAQQGRPGPAHTAAAERRSGESVPSRRTGGCRADRRAG